MRLHCSLTWHDALHITFSLLCEMPLIWNVTGLLHGHLIWYVKWNVFGEIRTTCVRCLFCKHETKYEHGKTRYFKSLAYGRCGCELKCIMFSSAHLELSSNNAQATLSGDTEVLAPIWRIIKTQKLPIFIDKMLLCIHRRWLTLNINK